MKNRKFVVVAFVICGLLVFAGCGGGSSKSGPDSRKSEEEGPVRISIMCAGDVMAHQPNINSALKPDDSYSFDENYEYVKKYIKKADLAMCNMETTFGGGTPDGYPMFNAPDELADAVKSAGFDVAITSNNHMMDTGSEGMLRTLRVLRKAGLETVGSHEDGEKGYIIEKVKGVKVGIVAYTYETPSAPDGSVTINSNKISDETAGLINSFNYKELDSGDLDRIKADVDGCRRDGADVVICYMHWGEEYEEEPNTHQKEMARSLADMGADVIFASHPHVLQKADVIESSSGTKVPVFYSLGNFISNQRTETLQNKYTESGAMATVTLTMDSGSDGVQAESVRIQPTWVDKYTQDGTNEFRIIPLDSKLKSNGTLRRSGHLKRAEDAEKYTDELFGDYIKGKTIFTSGGGTDDREGKAA